ncbi:helix-turn-helix domain-containing protein [Paenibacillus filicis]|uniref:Helix-turn-helix domain-containing protein n=1 Tax=Paenibacillus filicis TaxID=669464 RepID=A0ABU9DV35_9BACL
MNPSTSCPKMEKATQMISKRWSLLIIHQLLAGPQRFCTIETALPISGRLLSERLKDLEQEGIVNRDVFPEMPVRIEYSLTKKGQALEPVLRGIETWAHEWT